MLYWKTLVRESKQGTLRLTVQERLVAHMRPPRICLTTPTKHAINQPPSSSTTTTTILTFGT